MYFDFAELDPKERCKLLVSTITPRPIAWVVSQDAQGVLNAAPFSFFNAFAGDPPVVGIGVGSHKSGRPKDTRVNIQQTNQFVVNLVSESNASAMNVTAIEFDYGVNELEQASLTTLASTHIKPPRIAESPVAFECELLQIVELGPSSGLILGRVLAMHIRDDMLIDANKHYVDTPKLKLIGRMHGAGWYAKTSDLFQMDRIPVDQWTSEHGG
ncbi:flavin reductase family protein [Schlesneria paludicola]|uniref:flavin reductase family protein n=1 Tax=Schlesneria paludicola TaxID=360056 RepID=UPI00029B36B2|nr:flavin reductase family protein [Schlesneria paludicola]